MPSSRVCSPDCQCDVNSQLWEAQEAVKRAQKAKDLGGCKCTLQKRLYTPQEIPLKWERLQGKASPEHEPDPKT